MHENWKPYWEEEEEENSRKAKLYMKAGILCLIVSGIIFLFKVMG